MDKLSIVRPDMGGFKGAPIRGKIWCRDPTKVNGFFEIFRGLGGFMIRVDRGVGALVVLPPSLPRPRSSTDEDHDGDEESAPSLSMADWDAASKSKAASTGGTSSAVVVSSGPKGQTATMDVQKGAAVAGLGPAVDTPWMHRRDSIPLVMEDDQYGSNLAGAHLVCNEAVSPIFMMSGSLSSLVVEVEPAGGRPVGLGITAASLIPSVSSAPHSITPCLSPPVRSATSISALPGPVLSARLRPSRRPSSSSVFPGRSSQTT